MRCKNGCRLIFSVLALLGALGDLPAHGAAWKILPGHVPRVLAKLPAQGRLPATNQLHLAIGLPLRDPAGLDAFIAQVSDPTSANYRHYLTPEEFAARFGPTENDYAAVKNFALTNGLTISAIYRHRLVLDVTGPASTVEKALHVTLRTYRLPTGARDFFAADTEPMVSAALPVADISGLSNYQLPHPKNLNWISAHALGAQPKAGSGPGGSFLGNDFRAAYASGVLLRGSGQIIGLVEFDGYYANDIASYENLCGYTNVPLVNVLLNSVSGTPGFSGISSAVGEVSLDIEMAIAMAPGLSKVIVYEGNDQNSILSQMVSDNQAKQLSCSWGWFEGPSATTDNLFKEMIAQGQSFFNGSADSAAFTAGANSTNGVDNPILANAPSSCPYITQVGGTSLAMNGAGDSYSSETVWNWGNGTGSSGGVSSYYAIPSWQTSINMVSRGGSASFRNIPDVAMMAEDAWVVHDNNQASGMSGTSCSAPLWAGFMALVNEQEAALGQSPVGFINPAIYAIAAGTNYGNCFHDITSGNNFWNNSPNLFFATNGYDLCTGLGTPMGQNLINALAVSADALIVLPTIAAATGVAGGPFTVTSGNFQLANVSGSALTWTLAGTPTWLTLSATNGTLAAGAQTNLICNFTAATSNLAVGIYSANLFFTNQNSQMKKTILFSLQIASPLAISPTNGFVTSGPLGGPFNILSQDFSLTNQSGSSVAWTLINTSAWLNVSSASGTLPGGAQTTITISLKSTANTLAAGNYPANILVTNRSGMAALLPFNLKIAQPLVSNGGFESGNFTAWTETGDSSYLTVSSTSAYVHSGTYGVQLGPYGAMSYLSQTLATIPGNSYLVSCWLVNPKIGTPNEFTVLWNGATIFDHANFPALAWTNFQFLVTATATTSTVQFGFQNDPAYFGFDSVVVTPVEPVAFKSTVKSFDNFQLVWNATAGIAYQVQYKTNLLQNNWINLGAATTATSNSLKMTDTNAFQFSGERFYRLQALPAQ